MLFAEPPRSQGDVHFQLLGIPIRVHPWFWAVTLLLGIRPDTTVQQLLIWVPVVFVSIVVHELSHALAARYFGYRPWITLYGIGGLASYRPTHDVPRQQILISLAGPFGGFLLAGAVVLIMFAANRPVQFSLGGPYGFDWEVYVFNPNLWLLIQNVLFVNIFWGLINLLPVYPLDGGRVAREVATLGSSPRQGIVRATQLSIGVGIGVAALALFRLGNNGFFIAFLFGYLAYVNYKILQSLQNGYGDYGGERW